MFKVWIVENIWAQTLSLMAFLHLWDKFPVFRCLHVLPQQVSYWRPHCVVKLKSCTWEGQSTPQLVSSPARIFVERSTTSASPNALQFSTRLLEGKTFVIKNCIFRASVDKVLCPWISSSAPVPPLSPAWLWLSPHLRYSVNYTSH